jgi:5-hmdU DNA kinase-like protein
VAPKSIDENTYGGFVSSSGKVLETTPVFDLYWRFAFERQEIFYKRSGGGLPPWTDDPVLSSYRFTNAYRASDRVSQFLIRNVIYEGDQDAEEVFFRTLLFKIFNRIETWELLSKHLGHIRWKGFDFDRYDSILDRAISDGVKIYSSAYIMPSPSFGARRKHTNHLSLLVSMMRAGVPRMVTTAKAFRDVFTILRSFPSIGDFLAFQFAIDLNYSELTNFSEMEFVVAGPGAKSGIRKAFVDPKGLTDEQIIEEVTKAADREFLQRGLQFRTLWGRPLQLIDCQNLFCEIDKYSRVAYPSALGTGRTRIKRKFAAAPTFYPQRYPSKWNLRVG